MFDDFKNAFQRHNNAHAQLIIINVVIFLVLAITNVFTTLFGVPEVFAKIFEQLAMPTTLSKFLEKPWTLITHAFVHDISGILHILYNMLAFYWFGKLIVEYLGSSKLIAIYVLGFLGGAIAVLLTHNLVPFYMAQPGVGYGASAAVNAVIIAAAILLPDYTFFLIFLGPVRIKYIALFFVIASFVGSVGSNAGGDVAHLGGALMGFIYIKQLKAGVNWGGWITVTLDWFKDLFKSKPAVKVTYRKEDKRSAKPASPSKASQAEIDAILDKISDRGYESLTKEEKEKLFNASKK